MAKVGTKEMEAVPVEEAMTDEQMAEFVDMIMVLAGQARYQEVLGIWSEYMQRLFEEIRRKEDQHWQIRAILGEMKQLVMDRAASTPPEERNMEDAAEVMAINFISPIVEEAFGFSTYSGARRCSYIRSRIGKEIENVKAQVDPVRHILDEIRQGEANG